METLERLSTINFLSVADIALDIKDELQMSSEDVVTIPIIRQSTIRFSILLPAVAPNQLDSYYANRIKAVVYLKEAKAIKDFILHKNYSWEGTIDIHLNREEFNKFYDKFADVYDIRVVKPNANNSKKENGVPKFRFKDGVLFKDFSDNVLIFKDENAQEFRVIKTAMSMPINERIDAITDSMEMTFRQLYDTSRRLNEKIKATFGVDNFFETDATNKLVKRVVE